MIKLFFDIIRWKELLYLSFVLFLFKFSFLHGYGFETALSFTDLGLLAFSGCLILASGHLINYAYRKSKKKHVKFPIKKAKKYSYITAILGVFLGAFLCFKIGKLSYIIVFILSIIAVLVYSRTVTKKTFINNLVKAFLKSSIILLVLWFDAPINLSISQWNLFYLLETVIISYFIISFLSNIVREIIIDFNNINIDNAKKHNTLPIVLGRRRAKKTAIIIAIISCLFVFSFAIINLKNTFIVTTILLFGTLPELVFIYFLLLASSNKDYKRLYKLANVAYLLSMLTIPILAYYFKYVIT